MQIYYVDEKIANGAESNVKFESCNTCMYSVLQCDPNLVVYGVWINTLDPRLPRIALFSARDIDKGEELTFDYMMTGTNIIIKVDGFIP